MSRNSEEATDKKDQNIGLVNVEARGTNIGDDQHPHAIAV